VLQRRASQAAVPFPANNKMTEETIEAVAPRYNTESTLKYEVKPGENTADFEVSSH
jgi:hypothetical protein